MTLLVLLVDNVGTLLVPTMLANMVNTGITTGDVDYILRNGLYMFIATSMASGGTVLGCYLSARLAANVACDIRNAVYDKSLELAASDFERFGTGSMITRSLNDINVIQQAILQTIQLVLPVPFLAVAGIIFAWFIDPAMGTLLGVVVAIVLVAAVFTVANAAPIFMRLQGFIDRMNVVLRENIVGVRVIRAFNKERHEERRLDEVFSEYAANAIKVNHLFVGLDSSSFFLMNIAEVAVLWVGGNRVGAHAMQIASISAVLEYAILILFFVMMAQMVVLTLPRAAACLNRAQQVLEIEPSIVDGERTLDDGAREPQDEADAVAMFDHMSFRFDDADEDTLCDLSFACRRGQTTAIVGSTGSGKSTVAKLLLRFHDATKGAIRLDGVDLRELSQDEIRGHIAYVPQKAWLFSGTVASNLRFGNEDATETDMLHALEVAHHIHVEYIDRQIVLLAHRGGGEVHHAQVAGINLVEGDVVKLGGCGVLLGVGGVDAVHTRAFEHHVGFHLDASQSRACVGGEERVARAARNYRHLACLHSVYGFPLAVVFADREHIHGGEHLCRLSYLFKGGA